MKLAIAAVAPVFLAAAVLLAGVQVRERVLLVVHLGQSEVGDHYLGGGWIRAIEQQILGLDVQVQDAVRVQFLQSAHQVSNEERCIPLGEVPYNKLYRIRNRWKVFLFR